MSYYAAHRDLHELPGAERRTSSTNESLAAPLCERLGLRLETTAASDEVNFDAGCRSISLTG
jgi:hypothetical protein